MYSITYLLCLFVIIYPHLCVTFQSCHQLSTHIPIDNECSDISYEPSDRERDTNKIRLDFKDASLNITGIPWNSVYLTISFYGNGTNQFCGSMSNDTCVQFSKRIQNESFLLQYKSPDVGSGKLLFALPKPQAPLFLYVDITDLSRLSLRAHAVPTSYNVSYYKVQAFKEKNNVSTLVDMQLFSNDVNVGYNVFTYNDEGYYYFTVDAYYANGSFVRMQTPKVFVGRRRTRLVIGIVGASLILPFVLFVFHILTKKYPENRQLDDRIVVVYKSASKKHNEVVAAFTTLLQKLTRSHVVVETVDLARSKKFCNTSLLLASHILYIAPPIQDSENMLIYKSMSQKETYAVIFDHCTDKLPEFFSARKVFKLLEDFDRLLNTLNLPKNSDSSALFEDLRQKTEDAKIETDLQLNDGVLPKIVVTAEPEENESLISAKDI